MSSPLFTSDNLNVRWSLHDFPRGHLGNGFQLAAACLMHELGVEWLARDVVPEFGVVEFVNRFFDILDFFLARWELFPFAAKCLEKWFAEL